MSIMPTGIQFAAILPPSPLDLPYQTGYQHNKPESFTAELRVQHELRVEDDVTQQLFSESVATW